MSTPTRSLESRTLSVEDAGKLLGISRDLAYRLARETGELTPGVPVIRVGQRRLVVPVVALERLLGDIEPATPAAEDAEVRR